MEESEAPSEAPSPVPRDRGVLLARAALALGLGLVLVGLAVGGARVLGREREELERISPLTTLEPTDGTPHRELVRAEVREGEDVVFEVCTEDPLDPDVWGDAGVELIVWVPAEQEVVERVPLDRERLGLARRSSRGTCLRLAHGESIPLGGEFAIEAVWPAHLSPALSSTPFVGRVLAHRPLDPADRWPVWALLAGALLVTFGVMRGRATRPRPAAPLETEELKSVPTGGTLGRVLGGLAALVAVVVVLALVPLGGATIALGRGVSIALVEVLAAVVLVGAAGSSALASSRGARLGLVAPSWPFVIFAMPVLGVMLWLVGGFALRLVPATGEAPIETLVAWPSGSLALALVAVVVPIGEELFFRGLVFGQLERRWGGAVAFGATVVLFALAHLPQDWGAWGALTSVMVTGAGLTAIRWMTGSTIASALAHLSHNALIVVLTFA